MNRLRRILAFILALVLLISNLPAGTTAAAVVPGESAGNSQDQTGTGSPGGEPQGQNTQSSVITLAADDSRIHRSAKVNAPVIDGEEYKLSIECADIRYDYERRNVIPCIYNLRGLMTDKVGTSTDKGINRYPYVVTKVNVVEAGYYDLGVKVNMNAAATVNSMAIIVDGTVHVVQLEKTDAKQTVVAENVYLTAGEHSILYTSVLPQNESEINVSQGRTGSGTHYPWTNFWAFTYEGAALEVLDASTLTGTDVENIFKSSTRVEAEDARYIIKNIYSTVETNNAASGTKVVGGPAYANIKQTFDDLTANGTDATKTPYLQLTVEAPEAGTYYVTVGAYIGTSTNNSNPVPYIAVIANDNAPVKAQFDGKWNAMDSVTVALELHEGENVIRWTSVTPDQYSTGTAWVNQDYIELQNGLTVKRTKVDAADSDHGTYLYLNRYADKGSNFGGPNYNDMKWDYPSLYEDMYGIYADAKPERAGYWPYIAFKVNAPQAGQYRIGAKVETTAAAKTIGMIVDGSMYVVDVTTTSGVLTQSVYLTAGEHIIVFVPPIPQDMGLVPAQNNALYPWMNFCAFELDEGLSFVEAPTLTQINNSMRNYSRIEAEDVSCATSNGSYAADISKEYTRRYNSPYVAGVKGAAGAAIDAAVSADEKLVNTQQTYAEIEAGGLDNAKTSYVQYGVIAPKAGTYVIRVGAYLEGSGTMPYGTVLVNGVAYKAQFAGSWNGYYAVNLAVEMAEGENVIQLIGVTADQTATDGWIGYDFIDIPQGLRGKFRAMSAQSGNWGDYLYLNKYADCGTKFADPGSNTIYPDMKWDYPSLYEDMYGIYADAKPERAGYWPYIAFQVKAEQAGQYRISTKIATDAAAKTIGMIVDGSMYVVDVTTTSGVLTQSVYLTAGEHIIVFTSPIPQDMGLVPAKNDAMYPWMDFYAFELDDGLSFGEKPALDQIKASMGGDSRIEAEDFSYVVANGSYAADISKEYTRRYFSPYTATIKGVAGAAIDGTATAGEKQINTTQTYAEIEAGGLDRVKTSYVQYAVYAANAGTYTIRVGAYLEGSGDMPYGTVLVNGKAYKAKFAGSWNGYCAVNLAVELNEGKNTITCIGITADQTASDGWIGYDFVDLPGGITREDGRKEVSAADEDWADYVYLNRYTDSGSNFGGPDYNDFRYDYPSLYEDMLGIYSDAKPGRADFWPYIAVRVNAEEAGYYSIITKIETAAAETVGMIVDGAMYDADVINKQVAKSVYLTAGEHVVIFTAPMPRDMVTATTNDKALYPYINYCSFKLPVGVSFIEAPTLEAVQNSMQTYSRMEAEDFSYVTVNGNYAADVSKGYTRRYSTYNVTVKGAAGAAIDAAVTAAEKLVNTQQTYAEIAAGGLDKAKTSYVQYAVYAANAGTYTIRVGAYLEGSGDMPYGTVLVNGKAYKAEFSGNWNGYDAVNLAVELAEGENIIQLIGITADQTATDGWIGYDFVDIPNGVTGEDGRKEVSAADEDWADYVYLNRYTDSGSNFGGPDYNDFRYDYPSLYEDMLGIYSDAKPGRADFWPYIAVRVNADEAGYYPICAQVETAAAETVGMIVDGAMYAVDVTANKVAESVYLSAGEHVIIFTASMPQDMVTATTNDKALYPYINYCSFKLPVGVSFIEAPTFEQIKASLSGDSRIEAEDLSYVATNGSYAADISKGYTRRYSTYNVTVKGAAGAAIEGTVTAAEKLVNAQQTYAEIAAGGLDKAKTSYVEYTVNAGAAGTYMIRVGAYVEGSGTMPYGTVLVNGVAYKAQFAGSWNGYEAVNLAVELREGENTIQLIGITADQAESDGWIGYDFVELPAGVVGVKTNDARMVVSAADEDWADYLYLTRYQDNGSNFGVTSENYGHVVYDYPSLYEDMLGIYSDAKPGRAGYWANIAMRVNAQEAGYYEIRAQIETVAAKTVGMIIDGAMYDLDIVSNQVAKSVYLGAGEHVIIFTTTMPRDMVIANANNGTLYPWLNYCSFKLPVGLGFIEAPTVEQIQNAMRNFSRMEAEDFLYATANGNYAADISKSYTRRYSTYNVTVKGAAGAAIDGTVTAAEKLANTAQTYAEIAAGGLDNTKTSYVQYDVIASKAGTYVIRVGAYLEGSGTVPYGTVLVNGVAYKAAFSGAWNGYDVVNLAVELKAGENTITLIGITADQTAADGWIGYDFLEVSGGVVSKNEDKVVSANDEDWDTYLYLNRYEDTGDSFGKAFYADMYYDYPALYADMVGIYSDAKPGRAGYWPYIAFTVNASEAGYYQIAAQIATKNTAKTIGMIVDGAMHVVDVTTISGDLTTSVYLTEGNHVIIFTSPMPRDMLGAPKQENASYPYMDFIAFKLGDGLSYGDKPTAADIQASMTSYTRVEAEDIVYATYNGAYATDAAKKYNSRYNNTMVMIMGAQGAVIDEAASAEEMKANSSQTFAQLAQGLDAAKTPYVEYSVSAQKAGTYMIRIGAYVEGSGTMPYGTILVNETAYKVQFAGNWNGYDAVNLPVQLREGANTIRCIGVTADQTDANGWIGYDYLDIQSGLTANGTGATLVNAGDEAYVTVNKYKDKGDTLGDANRGDLQWDRLSIDALNYAYLDRIPYAAVKVTAIADGKYDIYFTSKFNANATSQQIGILVDGITSYPVTLSESRSHVSIELKKGTHTLVFTSPMPATMDEAAKTSKFDTKAYPWMDYETIILGKGLVLEKAPNKDGLENPFVAVEVEGHALPNLVKINANASGNGVYLKAQTAQQIVKSGIDPMVTPFVQFQIDASQAGEYTLYVALTSGVSGTMNSDRIKCSFVIETGDTRQVKSVYSFADTKNVVRVIPVTLKLEKGINVVRMTHFTGDSAQKAGYVWNDFDYIEMSPAASEKLTFLATTVLEAEDATYASYQEMMSNGMSGGAYLGKADYSYIDSNRVTFEALDVEDMGDLSRVTYLFEAEKAGTYTIAVKFGMGLTNCQPGTLDKMGFAVIVNGKDKQMVELSFGSASVQTTRLITVDLVEGENEVTFTSTLADYMNAVSPKIESEYWLVWADHDALYLPAGLSMGREAEKFGVEDSSVEHPQLELRGLTYDPDDADPADPADDASSDLLTGIITGTFVLLALVIVILIVIKSKQRNKNK